MSVQSVQRAAGSLAAESRDSRLRSLGVLLPLGGILEPHGVPVLLARRQVWPTPECCKRLRGDTLAGPLALAALLQNVSECWLQSG